MQNEYKLLREEKMFFSQPPLFLLFLLFLQFAKHRFRIFTVLPMGNLFVHTVNRVKFAAPGIN